MLGEKLVRHSVTPISSATETKRFSKTSKAMGSMRMRPSGRGCPGGDHVGELVEAEPEAGRNDGGRFAAGNHRGSVGGHAGSQIAPAEKRRHDGRAAEARLADAGPLAPAPPRHSS